jgi:hypothetical protein
VGRRQIEGRGVSRGFPELISAGVGAVLGGHHRRRLAGVGGVWGRHCAPSLGDRQVVSVAGWFRRGTSGFRVAGGETVGCGSVSVLGGAGRGCQRVRGTVPCTSVHGTGLARALMHGNASPALRALGGAVASERRDRGGVHGRARGLLLRGIDSSGRGKLGSEVTG